MTARRLQVALDFGDDAERAVAQLGWDAAQRHVVAEWDQGFAADPLPISPLLVKRHDALLRPRGRGFGDLPGLSATACPTAGGGC